MAICFKQNQEKVMRFSGPAYSILWKISATKRSCYYDPSYFLVPHNLPLKQHSRKGNMEAIQQTTGVVFAYIHSSYTLILHVYTKYCT